MRKFSVLTIVYLVLWVVLLMLYKFETIKISNSLLNNISAQILILGAFIFFMGYIVNKFLIKINEKKLDKWLIIYNLILVIAIAMTMINKSYINSNRLIEFITNTSYIAIGGCLLFGICSIKESLKVD